jgi:hypothetical protein
MITRLRNVVIACDRFVSPDRSLSCSSTICRKIDNERDICCCIGQDQFSNRLFRFEQHEWFLIEHMESLLAARKISIESYRYSVICTCNYSCWTLMNSVDTSQCQRVDIVIVRWIILMVTSWICIGLSVRLLRSWCDDILFTSLGK